jgi:hypothetical protein
MSHVMEARARSLCFHCNHLPHITDLIEDACTVRKLSEIYVHYSSPNNLKTRRKLLPNRCKDAIQHTIISPINMLSPLAQSSNRHIGSCDIRGVYQHCACNTKR